MLVLGVGYVCSQTARLYNSDESVRRGIDQLIAIGRQLDVKNVQNILEMMDRYEKPVLPASDTVLMAYGPVPNEAISEFESHGVSVYSSPSRAARTLAHMAERYEFINGISRRSHIVR